MRTLATLAILFLSGCVATPSVTDIDPNGTFISELRVLAPPERYAAAGQAMHDAGLIVYREVTFADAQLVCGGSSACIRFRLDGTCLVTLSNHHEPDFRQALIDHERAHCAGWPADHPP